jgi:hypothetical protein
VLVSPQAAVDQEFSRPGRNPAWRFALHQASDDDAVQHDVVAAGGELEEGVGHHAG